MFKRPATDDGKHFSQNAEHSPPRESAPAESRDPSKSCDSVKNTAAVLRLSDALQRAPRSQPGAVNTAQASSLSGHSFSVFYEAMLIHSANERF